MSSAEISTLDSGKRRVLVFGATGTIGRRTVRALLEGGHDVVCFLRRENVEAGTPLSNQYATTSSNAQVRFGNVSDLDSLERDGIAKDRFDAIVSCMAARSGAPKDAWAIDFQAHMNVLDTAQRHAIPHMVLLSAICVQKPVLAFQHAKLAFENNLIASGLCYTIVRPTAFFKSLSGQIERVKRGKPYVVFGDGKLTACKPIGAEDLGGFIAKSLLEKDCHNKILPIGGPGAAITPMDQGEKIFSLLGRKPKFKHVPIKLMDRIVWALSTLGRTVPFLDDKAELARIGRYYATESMLVLNPATGQYDSQATPSYGSQTLFDYYAQLIDGKILDERGSHAVF